MNKIIILAPLALTGCFASTPTNQFAVKDYDLETLGGTRAVQELRVFTTNAGKCAFESTPEAAPLVGIAAGFAVEQISKYVFSQLEEQSKYLKANLTLSAQTGLDEPWPSQDAAPVDVIEKSENNLCILLVAGEFESEAPPGKTASISDGTAFTNKLMSKVYGTKGDPNAPSVLSSYSFIRPGISTTQGNPFKGLKGDPQLVAEFRVASGRSGDKIISYISPMLLLYPHPLHEGAVNGPKRPFNITFGFGGSEATLVLDKYKSGELYSSDMLKTALAELVSDAGKKAVSLKITVNEGPDGMATAQVLDAVVAKKDDVTKYLVDKAVEAAEGKGKAEAAKKK